MKKAVFCVILAVLAAGCDDVELTDCSVREPNVSDPAWGCKKASSYKGACVPQKDFEAWGCLELDRDASLCDSAQPFNLTVLIKKSGVALDCRGQTIDHGYGVTQTEHTTSAIRASYEHSISDVTISNCKIRHVGRYGVDLRRFFRGDELEGDMAGHESIALDNLDISDTNGIGIYIGQNSHAVAITRVKVARAFLGIYLESGTSDSLISEVEVSESFEREALAVDSSHHNIIEKSRFSGAHGGVKLYHNCGERAGKVCPIVRPSGSNDNVLRSNVFVGASLEVAPRQFSFHAHGTCEEVDGSTGYAEDIARDNVIEGNSFRDTKLDIQDGPVFVRRNTFYATTVEIGIRKHVGHDRVEIAGELVSNLFSFNTTLDFDGRSSDHDHLVIRDNTDALGRCAFFNECQTQIATPQNATE